MIGLIDQLKDYVYYSVLPLIQSLEDVGINIISEYSSRFKVNAVGLSDHSGKLSPVLMSYFKGLEYLN